MKLAIVFIHLLATCMVLGIIMVADFRFFRKISNYKLILPAPSIFERQLVASCLMVLWITGLTLIILGQLENPQYLNNQKLQAKIALVCLITLNAAILHLGVFPFLEKQVPLYKWKTSKLGLTCCSVGLSNSMWMYCAFLGIARPWNFTIQREYVWAIAFILWVSLAITIQFTLTVAARNRPVHRMDWLDKIKYGFRVINENSSDIDDSVSETQTHSVGRSSDVLHENKESTPVVQSLISSDLQAQEQAYDYRQPQHA